MDKIELKRRTKRFAVDVIMFIEKLPNSRALNALSNQLIRSSSSEEEADESLYWLELMDESNLVKPEDLVALKKEADELTAIFTAIGKTAKANQQNNKLKKLSTGKSEIEIPKSEI